MHIRSKSSAKLVRSKDGEHTYELVGRVENITNQHSVAYIEIDVGKEALRHRHPKIEETFYILSGKGTIVIDKKREKVKDGDCIFVPGGCCHYFINEGNEKLVYLSICSPAWKRHVGTKCNQG